MMTRASFCCAKKLHLLLTASIHKQFNVQAIYLHIIPIWGEMANIIWGVGRFANFFWGEMTIFFQQFA